MSSVSAEFAQVGRRRGYFIATGSVVQYNITQDVNGAVTAIAPSGTTYSSSNLLQDMGEIAKYGGYLFRKVRLVTTTAPTGDSGSTSTYFIAMPGGEYPIQGVSAAGKTIEGSPATIVVAPVARLG